VKLLKEKITKINQIAKENQKEIFTSLYQLLNEEVLKNCFKKMFKKKIIGLNKSTLVAYLEDLEKNLKKLVFELKIKKFKPCLDNQKQTPYLETKLVELALTKIINVIYYPKLSKEMYGSRTNKRKKNALQKITEYIEKTNYIIELKDYIKIDENKLLTYLSIYIKDSNILKLIKKYLEQGLIEKENTLLKKYILLDDYYFLSNTLCDIYTYYTFIKDIEEEKNKWKKGLNFINYYDETILFIECQKHAEIIYQKLLNKTKEENISCHIALKNFGKNDLEKNTFEFLGFVHYGIKNKNNEFKLKRKTSSKKITESLVEFNKWCKKNNHRPLKEIMNFVKKELIIHYNYYGITGNSKMLKKYYSLKLNILYKWLNRRSERKSYTRAQFKAMIKNYNIPKPTIKIHI